MAAKLHHSEMDDYGQARVVICDLEERIKQEARELHLAEEEVLQQNQVARKEAEERELLRMSELRADALYKGTLLRRAFGAWQDVTQEGKNEVVADQAFNESLQRKVLHLWRANTEAVQTERAQMAESEAHADGALQHRVLHAWRDTAASLKGERLKRAAEEKEMREAREAKHAAEREARARKAEMRAAKKAAAKEAAARKAAARKAAEEAKVFEECKDIMLFNQCFEWMEDYDQSYFDTKTEAIGNLSDDELETLYELFSAIKEDFATAKREGKEFPLPMERQKIREVDSPSV